MFLEGQFFLFILFSALVVFLIFLGLSKLGNRYGSFGDDF